MGGFVDTGINYGHPRYMYPGSDHYQQISELWDHETFTWDDGLLQMLFSTEDQECIKATRLSPRCPQDKLRWKFSTSGEYNVRSGYHHDFSLWWNSTVQPSIPIVSKETWTSCWHLETPPRLRTFLWRLLDNNIPFRENLKTWGIIEVTNCPLCDSATETTEHLFIECPITRRFLENIGYNPALRPLLTFAMAWEDFAADKGKPECGKLLAALWGVWKIRNSHVFDTPNQAESNRILEKSLRYVEDYVRAQAKEPTSNLPSRSTWSPPAVGFIKINTDAGILNNIGGQVSAIARDENGNLIQAAVKIIANIQHPTLLEGYGVLLGLQLAVDLACTQAIIKSDCQPLVQALQSNSNNRSDIATLIDDCMEAARAIDVVQFSFARRSANQPAHLLAKMQGPFTELVHFLAVPPASVVDALVNNVIAITG